MWDYRKLNELLVDKPEAPPPECEVMCPKHHYALEACGKCLEDAKYRTRNALFLRALFVIGVCSFFVIAVQIVLQPSLKAYDNINEVKAQYATILQNYSCAYQPEGLSKPQGCICNGYWYPDCKAQACWNGTFEVVKNAS